MLPGAARELDDPIALSALQHAVYCLRQAALIHIERMWEENRFTAEGRVLHNSVHEAADHRRGSIRRVSAMPLACRRLNLAGTADLVEFRDGPDGETAFPVEYKRGKAKLHRADEVQLCAQALCLEEMTGRPVPEGALFYASTRRRVGVPFDAELRRLTEDVAISFRALVDAGRTPAANFRADRCNACSLLDLCRPKLARESAADFRNRAIQDALADTPRSDMP
ncbi:CRISPR-associated protein Cas4 [Rhodopseudomonas palustris]|nr:CRISPR-associated protein Cas4 [Rhodopseudomonas palustris]